jgi:thymidylate kinase
MFMVPAPEFEFIVLIIRLALKHLAWDVILGGDGPLRASERREVDYLQARISWDRVERIVREHLPAIGVPLLRDVLAALEPGCSVWKRMRMGARVQSRLRAQARRSPLVDVALKMGRRVICAAHRRVDKNSLKYRLESGGVMIAIVGGDGSGKSTAVDALQKWLSKHFATTRIHMGKPDWSCLTTSVRAVLKVGNLLGLYPVDANFRDTLRQKSLVSPGYPWLIRNLCRARDRYQTYLRARRCVAGGSVVLLDRIPLAEVQLMDGPQADRFISELTGNPQSGGLFKPRRESWLAKLLVEREERYYRDMPAAEMLFVLRVDPETAIQRRPEDDPAMVRERNQEIWEMNWEREDAHVIDGTQPREDVKAAIKSIVWSQL